MQTPDTQQRPPLADIISAMLARQPERKPRAKAPTTSAPGTTTKEKPPTQVRGEWRLSTRWTDQALVCVEQTCECANCGRRETASQPHIYLERYHPQFGVHREALGLQSGHDTYLLPRRIARIESRVMYCRHCFITSNTATAQPRLPFDLEQPATFTDSQGTLHLTDLFNTNGAPAPEGTLDIAPKVRPEQGAIPFYPLMVI